jgi:hypothetical protein
MFKMVCLALIHHIAFNYQEGIDSVPWDILIYEKEFLANEIDEGMSPNSLFIGFVVLCVGLGDHFDQLNMRYILLKIYHYFFCMLYILLI